MESRESAIGNTYRVIGVLNLFVGGIAFLIALSGNSNDRNTGFIVAVAGFSGALGCFAIAAGLSYLAEIAYMVQNTGSKIATNLDKMNEFIAQSASPPPPELPKAMSAQAEQIKQLRSLMAETQDSLDRVKRSKPAP